MTVECRLELRGHDGAAGTELAGLTRVLEEAGASRVVPLVVGELIPGRRAVDPVAVASLAVSFAGTLVMVVDTIRRWLAERTPSGGGRSVRIVIDGDLVEITEPSTAAEERLVEEFLRRHPAE